MATCPEEETRWEAKSGRPVLTALSEWIASLEAPPVDLPPAERPGWWRHDMSCHSSVKGVLRWMAPRLLKHWSL